MQIRTRLTVQFTLLVSGILLVSFLSIYYLSFINIKEDFFVRLRQKAISTAELLLRVKQVDNELMKILDKSSRNLIYNENILIFDEKNRLVYTNTDSPAILVSNFWLDEIRKAGVISYTDGDYQVVGITYKYAFNRVVVLLGAQDLYGQANLNNLRAMLVILFVVVTAIVALAGWFFAQRALMPISKIMNEVEGILPQKLDTRLEVPNQKDEIGRLTATFNNLLDRIENAFRMQKTFVANVSHELKNPLTKMSSQLEVSLLKDRSSQQYQSTLRSVLEDIKELSQLSNALLELAKVSEDRRDALTEIVRLDELLWDARTTLIQTNSHYRIQFNLDELPEDDTWLEVLANPTLLKTAFLNLMDNACKFSNDNTVQVNLNASKEKVVLRFSDNGKGIPEQDQTLIFQPFYRGVNTANDKGYGIGLSLVERIVKLHKGTVQIDPAAQVGTTFVLTFWRN